MRRAFKRTGLFPLAFAARERLLAVDALLRRDRIQLASDAIPLPPPHLRILVHGAAGVADFLETGASAVVAIDDGLRSAGSALADKHRILDFGCGCGRVLRHVSNLDAELNGVDVNARSVGWCRSNLAFANCLVCGPQPPLPYPSQSFDLVYAISVFTHLPEQSQLRWAAELERLVAPGGHLMLTTTGESFRDELSAAERERFDGGEVIIRHPRAAGRNACVAVHPPGYVRSRLVSRLEPAAFHPCGLHRQDVHVFVAPPRREEAAS